MVLRADDVHKAETQYRVFRDLLGCSAEGGDERAGVGGLTAGRPPEVLARVVQLRLQGLSVTAIGAVLNTDGVLTPSSRPPWPESHVDRLLHTRYVQEFMDVLDAA